MKKYRILLTALCVCLFLPIRVIAAQSEIGTEVPTNHSVSIEAEHASASYLGESKGDAEIYLVPRFSEPEFGLHAEEGWYIQRVWLGDMDVTDQVTEGILKLPKIYENQTITIETVSMGSKDTGKTTVTGSVTNTPKGMITTIHSKNTGDRFAIGLALLVLCVGVALFCVKGKNRKKDA